MSEKKKLEVGDVVIYHDPTGKPFNAVLTESWGGLGSCVNLVYVSGDAKERDAYGRQIKHESSVSHVSSQGVHGRYYRLVDEEPNGYVAPASV